ncbi:hypothetical protein D3C86_2265410 [compost metagenome]
MVALPFSAGVYVPVGYLTGRLDIEAVWSAFASVTVGILVVNIIGVWMWRKGVNVYAGTGA